MKYLRGSSASERSNISNAFSPASLPAINVSEQLEYRGVVRQCASGNRNFRTRTSIIEEVPVVMTRQSEMYFAGIRLQSQRVLQRGVSEGEPRRRVINVEEIKLIVHVGQKA